MEGSQKETCERAYEKPFWRTGSSKFLFPDLPCTTFFVAKTAKTTISNFGKWSKCSSHHRHGSRTTFGSLRSSPLCVSLPTGKYLQGLSIL